MSGSLTSVFKRWRGRASGDSRALEEDWRFIDSIVENIPDMIFVKDAEHLQFVRFNRAGEELLGYTRDELLGKSDYDLFPKEEADFFTRKDREVLKEGRIVKIPEETIATRYRGERVLRTTKIPIRNEKGEPEYLLGISEDITERLEEQEKRLKAEAEEREMMERMDRLNTIGLLAAGMAHEINNPLQGMLSHLRNLKRSAGKDEQALNSVLMIERGTEIIATLIQKLLTLGSPEREHTAEEAEIGAVLRSVTQLTESQFARAGVRLVLEDAESTLRLTISEKELIQVLLNLMINARDAMAGGGGVLTVSATAEDDCGVIRVRDTGVGMTPDTLNKIFMPFFSTKGLRGTGLGLVVAASLVRAAGGMLEVESEPGRGSTFILRIPLGEGAT